MYKKCFLKIADLHFSNICQQIYFYKVILWCVTVDMLLHIANAIVIVIVIVVNKFFVNATVDMAL